MLSSISPQSSIDQMMVSAIIRWSSVRYFTALTPGDGVAILETLRPWTLPPRHHSCLKRDPPTPDFLASSRHIRSTTTDPFQFWVLPSHTLRVADHHRSLTATTASPVSALGTITYTITVKHSPNMTINPMIFHALLLLRTSAR